MMAKQVEVELSLRQVDVRSQSPSPPTLMYLAPCVQVDRCRRLRPVAYHLWPRQVQRGAGQVQVAARCVPWLASR